MVLLSAFTGIVYNLSNQVILVKVIQQPSTDELILFLEDSQRAIEHHARFQYPTNLIFDASSLMKIEPLMMDEMLDFLTWRITYGIKTKAWVLRPEFHSNQYLPVGMPFNVKSMLFTHIDEAFDAIRSVNQSISNPTIL